MVKPAATTAEYKVIGTRPIRHDGTDKVIGKAIYGADVRPAGALAGKVLRSPHAHARIVSIDTSKAEAMEGVGAVVTGRDLPRSNPDQVVDLVEEADAARFMRDNTLASNKVLYRGHAVAAVAAVSAGVAEEALEKIDVVYEVLPPVLDVLDAMKPGAPLLHESLTTESMGEPTGRVSNIATHIRFQKGEPEVGFGEADLVIERELRTATVHQGYIEPHNAVAQWNPDGQVTVWCSTQGAFGVQKQLASILKHPLSKIRVVPMEIGGGFGGKLSAFLEPVAARLAQKSGRVVKMTMSRPEVFEGTGPTPGSFLRIKMGAKKNGKLTAAKAWMAYESGAFPGCAIEPGGISMFACYDISHAQVDGYDVVVNKPKSRAYRAPGATQSTFATETVIDELARVLNIDPLDFRLRNASVEGTRRIDGLVFQAIGCVETLEAVRDHPGLQNRPSGKNQGRGIAVGFWRNGSGQSSVVASVCDDGRVDLISGSVDIGGTRPSVAMQFAEVLGLRAEDINPTVGDTRSIGYTDNTAGSRTTFTTGLAAYQAAHDVKAQMIQRASRLWDVDENEVGFRQGTFFKTGDPSVSLSFKELAGQLSKSGGPVIASASAQPKSGIGGSFVTNVCDVEVDPETGKVKVLRFVVIQDAGRAIHPSYVENQMQGGAVQGIGWALNEEYFFNEDGQMANSSFLDYRMPTAYDLPPIETIIVEVPSPGHPFGVRGVGEASIAPPPAAVANAVFDAVGARLYQLPLRPDRIWNALQSKAAAEAAG